ncbi:MAG TPA: branched-chain amino acid ABC transporter permease [Hyphomicrobiales bacterium]|nr:branched-chain amino acid ABC transporter permease [Hyphomicrobiales bacterium]
MTMRPGFSVQRFTPLARAASVLVAVVLVVLALGPFLFGATAEDNLTLLFVYVILGAMWNALAGYGGLVSVGQQAFFGLGAYAAIRLSSFGVPVYLAIVLGALLAGAVAVPLSSFALRLRGGEFAIGMWVVAELAHLLVNLDGLIQGETGTSLIALNAYAPQDRRAFNYWLAFAAMLVLLGAVFALLRGRLGAAVQAIRDNEEAAASLGVRVLAGKRVIFVLAAVGCAMAGSLYLSYQISFQPKAYFGVNWTAYMIFMALVGGLGTFEGPIVGAIVFFLMERAFGATGVWYLVGLGAVALVFALFLPRGLWGTLEDKTGIRIAPLGYRLRLPEAAGRDTTR